MPNHVQATNACDIRASDGATAPYPPFDLSSMAYATPADWQAIPNTHHCDAMFSEALDLIKNRMDM
jgi:hypothetical protein